MKVVINKSYGGFGLSEQGWEAYKKFCKKEGRQAQEFYWDIPRDDPALVHAVEKLGDRAADMVSRLKVVEIPDGIEWFVHEGQGGVEWVAEVHRKWE